MLVQYLKFFINGGLLGVVAWGLQWFIYSELSQDTFIAYGISTALTFAPLIIINFIIQRKWIFSHRGLFQSFLVANLVTMILVSILSLLCRYEVNQILGIPWGDRFGFICAALIGSIPSFFLMRIWVFSDKK